MSRTIDGLTPADVEAQYDTIRSAAIQSWLAMLLLCAAGTVFVGVPLLFAALAILHTGGLPFVLGYARRWRDGLLYEVSCKSFSRKRR